MPFSADEGSQVIAGREQPVVRLCADDAAAELLRGLGFNCVRWQIAGRDMLYCPPLDELAERPTRGGIPVLVPVSRIASATAGSPGTGKSISSPRTTRRKQNAIHGFTPREPWGLVDLRSDADSAWMEAAFPPRATWTHQWPGVGVISLKIQLNGAMRYDITARIVNYDRDSHPFPFGLGFHPYFAVTPDCRMQTPAETRWELVDSLPTGRRLPLDEKYDLREPRPVGELTLDDVYTDFPGHAAGCRRPGRTRPGRISGRRRPAGADVAGVSRAGGVHAAAPQGGLPGAVHLPDRRDPPAGAGGRGLAGAAAGRAVGGGWWRFGVVTRFRAR